VGRSSQSPKLKGESSKIKMQRTRKTEDRGQRTEKPESTFLRHEVPKPGNCFEFSAYSFSALSFHL
jgi:hypothetical protein